MVASTSSLSVDFTHVLKYFVASSMTDAFENVDMYNSITFLTEIHLHQSV